MPARLRWGTVVVSGSSMEPTLREGDRLVVRYAARVCLGALVVVRLPASESGPRPLSVKRVTGRDPGDPSLWWVERDNPAEGVDSWLVGGIPESDVLAVVRFRLPRALRRSR